MLVYNSKIYFYSNNGLTSLSLSSSRLSGNVPVFSLTLTTYVSLRETLYIIVNRSRYRVSIDPPLPPTTSSSLT